MKLERVCVAYLNFLTKSAVWQHFAAGNREENSFTVVEAIRALFIIYIICYIQSPNTGRSFSSLAILIRVKEEEDEPLPASVQERDQEYPGKYCFICAEAEFLDEI